MILPCLTLPQLEFGARCEGRRTQLTARACC